MRSAVAPLFFCHFLGFLTDPTQAQIAIATNTEFGLVEIYGGVTKSTHLGAFDRYVGPPLLREARAYLFGHPSAIAPAAPPTGAPVKPRPRRPTGLDLLLPGGKFPKGARWSYDWSPGVEIGVAIDSPALPTLGPTPARLSLFMTRDSNVLRIDARKGLGILIDPTQMVFRATYSGWGVRYDVPIWTAQAWGGRHRLLVGLGMIAFRSKTLATAKSAFLDIRVRDRSKRTSPLFAASYEFLQETPMKGGLASPRSVGLDLRLFETQRFYTLSATVRGLISF